MELENTNVDDFNLEIELDICTDLKQYPSHTHQHIFQNPTAVKNHINTNTLILSNDQSTSQKDGLNRHLELGSPVFQSPVKSINNKKKRIMLEHNLVARSMDQNIRLVNHVNSNVSNNQSFYERSRNQTPQKNKRKNSNSFLMSSPLKKQSRTRNNNHIVNSVVTNLNRLADSESDCDTIEGRFESDFKIIRFLGKGHFGSVYEVINKIDKMKYAIKQSKKKIRQMNSSAVKEVQALASLSANCENSNVVRYYSAWIENNKLYLQMEFCDDSLQNIYNKHIELDQNFSENEIRKILKQILKALKYLHSQQIVHLDIKPDNILICNNKDKYKLADLGLARISKHIENQDIEEGDCRYLAQEVLANQRAQDLTKSDIFSLGITIYQLMMRQSLPKNGDQWTNIRKNIRIDSKVYSQQLVRLIESMMNEDPQSRPSAEDILGMDIFKNEHELELKWQLMLNKHLSQVYKQIKTIIKNRSKSI